CPPGDRRSSAGSPRAGSGTRPDAPAAGLARAGPQGEAQGRRPCRAASRGNLQKTPRPSVAGTPRAPDRALFQLGVSWFALSPTGAAAMLRRIVQLATLN